MHSKTSLSVTFGRNTELVKIPKREKNICNVFSAKYSNFIYSLAKVLN